MRDPNQQPVTKNQEAVFNIKLFHGVLHLSKFLLLAKDAQNDHILL